MAHSPDPNTSTVIHCESHDLNSWCKVITHPDIMWINAICPSKLVTITWVWRVALGSAKLTDFGLAKQYRGGRDAIAEAARTKRPHQMMKPVYKNMFFQLCWSSEYRCGGCMLLCKYVFMCVCVCVCLSVCLFVWLFCWGSWLFMMAKLQPYKNGLRTGKSLGIAHSQDTANLVWFVHFWSNSESFEAFIQAVAAHVIRHRLRAWLQILSTMYIYIYTGGTIQRV